LQCDALDKTRYQFPKEDSRKTSILKQRAVAVCDCNGPEVLLVIQLNSQLQRKLNQARVRVLVT